MTRYVYTVMSTPKAGTDDEYAHWAKHQHIDDVLKVAGFTSAQCLRLIDCPMNNVNDSWTFLVIYQLETDDPGAALAELKRRFGTDQMPRTEHSDPSKIVRFLWALESERHEPEHESSPN